MKCQNPKQGGASAALCTSLPNCNPHGVSLPTLFAGSNDNQIKQLDAKSGTLSELIQGSANLLHVRNSLFRAQNIYHCPF